MCYYHYILLYILRFHVSLYDSIWKPQIWLYLTARQIFILSNELLDVSAIMEWFQYSNTPAASHTSVGLLTDWVGVPVRRGFMTLHTVQSPHVGLKQPSVHWGCWAFLPAPPWLSWSLQKWRLYHTHSKADVPSGRMDLPGYQPQHAHPSVHHPGNQREDMLNLEPSSACEYQIVLF